MADSEAIFVYSKGILLKMSSVDHPKKSLGNKGPKNESELPGYINLYHIKDIITKKDMSGLGQDYLLTNDELHDIILKRFQ